MAKRVCIVGTAPTYAMTPWADRDIEIWSLNNAYEVKGFKRADRWFDFHPLDKFVHPTPNQMIDRGTSAGTGTRTGTRGRLRKGRTGRGDNHRAAHDSGNNSAANAHDPTSSNPVRTPRAASTSTPA